MHATLYLIIVTVLAHYRQSRVNLSIRGPRPVYYRLIYIPGLQFPMLYGIPPLYSKHELCQVNKVYTNGNSTDAQGTVPAANRDPIKREAIQAYYYYYCRDPYSSIRIGKSWTSSNIGYKRTLVATQIQIMSHQLVMIVILICKFTEA